MESYVIFGKLRKARKQQERYKTMEKYIVKCTFRICIAFPVKVSNGS